MKLFSPGPVELPSEVLGPFPNLHHRSAEFRSILEYLQGAIREIIGASDKYSTVGFTSTGTGAMEAVVSSLREGDRCLVVSNGYFGDRLYRIAARYSANVRHFELGHRACIDENELSKVLDEYNPRWVLCVHHETRTSRLNDIRVISKIVKEGNRRLGVDCTSSIVCEEISCDRLDLDLVFFSSAKGLCSLPGLAFVSAKNEVFQELQPSPPSTYFDLRSEYESQICEGGIRFAQAPQLYIALERAVVSLLLEGICDRRKRIHRQTNLVRKWACMRGITPVVGFDQCSSACSTFYSPMPYSELSERMKNYGCVIFYGEAGRDDQFQISTMGSLQDKDISHLVESFDRVLGT